MRAAGGLILLALLLPACEPRPLTPPEPAPDPGAGAGFVPNARGRWQADLYLLARRKLAAAGVGAVYGGGLCTFGDSDRFFSYRRDGQCGRMATFIHRAS